MSGEPDTWPLEPELATRTTSSFTPCDVVETRSGRRVQSRRSVMPVASSSSMKS
jgi:hypothetical protein